MRILMLVVLMAVAGCAAQPGINDAGKDVSGQGASASATLVAPSESIAAAAVVEKQEAFKPPKGYRKRVEGSTIFYCARMVVLGSRFPKEDCRTQAELEDLALQRESMRGEMEQRGRTCTSAAGCANP